MAIAAVSFTILLLTFGGSLAQVSSYNIYDIALEDFINDYKTDAAATIQIANTLTEYQVLIGFTQLLRPFRTILKNIISNVIGTPEVSCLRATYNLTDVTTLPQRTFTQVKVVNNISFEIAKFYSASFINCTSTYANTLNKNLERIPAVENTLKKLVANGNLTIKHCPVSYVNNDIRYPLLNHTDACVKYYVLSLQKFRTLFLKAVGGIDIAGEDLSIQSDNILNKELFSIPNCLFAASDDAISTANIYLKDVEKCIGSIRWTNQELSVFGYVPHIQTALQFLPQYYTTKNDNIGTILSHYGNIAFLNNDLEAGTAYRNQNSLVESVFIEYYIRSLDVSSKSSNLTLKLCIFDAGRLLLQQIQSLFTTKKYTNNNDVSITNSHLHVYKLSPTDVRDARSKKHTDTSIDATTTPREIKLRSCVDVALNETKKLLSGYTNILNPLRSTLSELTALLTEPTKCYSANLFNSFDIEDCFTSLLNYNIKRRFALQGTNMEDFKKSLRSYIGSVTIAQYCRNNFSPPNTELQNLIKCSPLLASS